MTKTALAIALAAIVSGCANDPAMTNAAMMVMGSATTARPTSIPDAGTVALAAALAKSGAGQKRYDCADLTHEQAQVLLDQGHTYLDPEKDNIACGKLTPADVSESESTTFAAGVGAGVSVGAGLPNVRLPTSTYTQKQSKSSGSNCHWVDGYTRKNGTHVKGHRRCN